MRYLKAKIVREAIYESKFFSKVPVDSRDVLCSLKINRLNLDRAQFIKQVTRANAIPLVQILPRPTCGNLQFVREVCVRSNRPIGLPNL